MFHGLFVIGTEIANGLHQTIKEDIMKVAIHKELGSGLLKVCESQKLTMFVAGYAILGSAFVPRMMRWMDSHGIPPPIEDLIMCSGLVLVTALVFMCECRRKS